MPWLNEGENSDVLLLGLVNLKRNYADLPFSVNGDETQLENLEQRVRETLELTYPGAQFSVSDANDEAEALEWKMEELCYGEGEAESPFKRLRFEANPRLLLTLGRQDNLAVSCLCRGGDLLSANGEAQRLALSLAEAAPFAFQDNWGYLTARPEFAGNALTGAYLMHLAGLNWQEKIDEIRDQLKPMHLSLQGFKPDEDGETELYVLYGAQQLGKSPEDALDLLQDEAVSITRREREALEEMLYDDVDAFADDVMRALGILLNARLMDFDELLTQYLRLRSGLTARLIEGSYQELDAFVRQLSPYCLQKEMRGISRREEQLIRADRARMRFAAAVKESNL